MKTCDEWMPAIQVGMSLEQFHQLPRHPAYKYEFIDGRACLLPRPKHYHALLNLEPKEDGPESPSLHSIRRVCEPDLKALAEVFAAAFRRIQPFGSLEEEMLLEAARQSLARTRLGGDGPWLEQASFLAEQGQKPAGAILITLLPGGDPCARESYYWDEPFPADGVAGRLGQPHLTWIFVAPELAGQGLGTALLAAAVRELHALGYGQLWSTFLRGNDSSMLWHWRNGFQLLSYPGSRRLARRDLAGARS